MPIQLLCPFASSRSRNGSMINPPIAKSAVPPIANGTMGTSSGGGGSRVGSDTRPSVRFGQIVTLHTTDVVSQAY